MCAVVDEQVIIAVELELVETQHETLQDRLRLECYNAVQIRFILRSEHGTVNLPIELLQKVVFAQRRHVIYKYNRPNNKTLLIIYVPIITNTRFID